MLLFLFICLKSWSVEDGSLTWTSFCMSVSPSSIFMSEWADISVFSFWDTKHFILKEMTSSPNLFLRQQQTDDKKMEEYYKELQNSCTKQHFWVVFMSESSGSLASHCSVSPSVWGSGLYVCVCVDANVLYINLWSFLLLNLKWIILQWQLSDALKS